MSFVFYAQIHQPLRLSDYRVFDVGSDKEYFDGELNKRILLDCARRCYRPTLRILKRALEDVAEAKLSFSISGLVLEQLESYAPEVLFDIEDLLSTGRVELFCESYYHSLSYVRDPDRFFEEVAMHRDAMTKRFGVVPRVLRNTELIFDESLAQHAHAHGYSHVLACIPNEEGVVRIAKSPVTVPLKSVRLSDDIAFRFSDHTWAEYPLSAATYARWVSEADHAHVFIDLETFGEHHREETGILSFLEELFPALARQGVGFALPSELEASRTISVSGTTSWADRELDLSAWLGNRIQKAAFEAIWALEEAAFESGHERTWRELLTSDHFYYMATKSSADGIVHSYFNPYGSPYEAFIRYMNVVKDFGERIREP